MEELSGFCHVSDVSEVEVKLYICLTSIYLKLQPWRKLVGTLTKDN